MSEDLVKKHGLERFGWQDIETVSKVNDDTIITQGNYEEDPGAVPWYQTFRFSPNKWQLGNNLDDLLTALALAMEALEITKQGNEYRTLATLSLSEIKQILEKGTK